MRQVLAKCLLGLVVLAPMAGASARDRIEIHVTPYYDAEGPVVDIDPAWNAGLSSKDPATVRATVASMRQAWPSLSPVSMFVAAIRQYDMGDRDDAVYWFYEAQVRARVFSAAVAMRPGASIGDPAFELQQAHGAFMQLAGEAINGYGACDIDKLVGTLERVRADAATPADYAAMYPALAFDDVAGHTREVIEGLSGLIAMFREQKDAMQAQRARNGANTRYCTP